MDESHGPMCPIRAGGECLCGLSERMAESSTEYFGEGGTNDHMDEARQDEDEADDCYAKGGP